jgi:tripartite-type tricarboxylate transporter receptor subunit TctC
MGAASNARVTTVGRWAALPDIPAVAETVPGYEVIIWYGMFAPKNTSPEIVTALNRRINAGLSDPKVVARIVEGGGVPMPTTTEEFGKFVSDDVEKWRKVIEFAGISAD